MVIYEISKRAAKHGGVTTVISYSPANNSLPVRVHVISLLFYLKNEKSDYGELSFPTLSYSYGTLIQSIQPIISSLGCMARQDLVYLQLKTSLRDKQV